MRHSRQQHRYRRDHGSDAGGKVTKTAESIVPETAKAVNLTNAQYNSFTKNGLKVNITYAEKSDTDAGEEFNYSSETYLAKQRLVTRALYNWWIPESLDLINESLGINFTDGRASINEINIEFTNDLGSFQNMDCATELFFDYDMGRASSVTLCINSDLLYNMTADDKNGILDGDKSIYTDFYSDIYFGSARWINDRTAPFSDYLDRILLQTLAEVAIKSNVPYAYYLPKEITSGLCEIVGGFDSGSPYSEHGLNGFIGKGNLYNNQAYGYALMRYLAKNYSDGMPDGLSYNSDKTVLTATTTFSDSTIDLNSLASTVKNVNASALKKAVYIIGNALNNSIASGSGNDTLAGNEGADILIGGEGNDSIMGKEGNDRLYGKAGNDKLYGGAGNDSLSGGSGADTLSGGAGNDTLVGGDGNDLLIYVGGNDVISDYATGDKISLGAAISKATVSGSNVVFTIGKGSLTITNGKDKSLSMINSSGKSFSTIISGSGGSSSDSAAMTVTDSSPAAITAGSDVQNVDASKRTKAVKITGNTLANSIKGGAGNDSLIGGDGADTLRGGKGNDSLLGGAGNDIIWGNTGADKLYGNAGADVLYGGAGNDSIWGGGGNDTLWGNNGTDTFIFWAGGGTDEIMDFASGESLRILTKDGSANATFSKSSFSDDILTLTVNGGGTIIFNDVESSTEFNINGTAYKVSGSKLAKK